MGPVEQAQVPGCRHSGFNLTGFRLVDIWESGMAQGYMYNTKYFKVSIG